MAVGTLLDPVGLAVQAVQAVAEMVQRTETQLLPLSILAVAVAGLVMEMVQAAPEALV